MNIIIGFFTMFSALYGLPALGAENIFVSNTYQEVDLGVSEGGSAKDAFVYYQYVSELKNLNLDLQVGSEPTYGTTYLINSDSLLPIEANLKSFSLELGTSEYIHLSRHRWSERRSGLRALLHEDSSVGYSYFEFAQTLKATINIVNTHDLTVAGSVSLNSRGEIKVASRDGFVVGNLTDLGNRWLYLIQDQIMFEDFPVARIEGSHSDNTPLVVDLNVGEIDSVEREYAVFVYKKLTSDGYIGVKDIQLPSRLIEDNGSSLSLKLGEFAGDEISTGDELKIRLHTTYKYRAQTRHASETLYFDVP